MGTRATMCLKDGLTGWACWGEATTTTTHWMWTVVSSRTARAIATTTSPTWWSTGAFSCGETWRYVRIAGSNSLFHYFLLLSILTPKHSQPLPYCLSYLMRASGLLAAYEWLPGVGKHFIVSKWKNYYSCALFCVCSPQLHVIAFPAPHDPVDPAPIYAHMFEGDQSHRFY